MFLNGSEAPRTCINVESRIDERQTIKLLIAVKKTRTEDRIHYNDKREALNI